MSFIRPESRALLTRWAAPTILAGIIVFALSAGITAYSQGNVIFVVLNILVLLACLIALRLSIQRSILYAQKLNPGMVLLDERRLSYFGPDYGGTVSIDEITHIDITIDDQSRANWYIHTPDEILRVPTGAKDADQLADAFAPLQGFDWGRVKNALAQTRPQRIVIWEQTAP